MWKTTYRGRRPAIVGGCLAFMLAAALALAGTASAALWAVCSEGSGLTKYSSNQCTKAESAGKWQQLGLAAGKHDTVKLVAVTLTLKDTKTTLGEAEVQCAGVNLGKVVIEGSNKGKVTAFEVEKPTEHCKGVKVCKEKEVEEVKGVNLPWDVELTETEKKFSSKIVEGSGGKEPGWVVKCKTSLGAFTDECLTESEKAEQVSLENKVSSEISLVLGAFKESHKEKCSQGGAEAGVESGQFAALLYNGNGLSISGISVPAPPETSCPVTTEGVSFDEVVTSGNEAALREAVVNDTWVPIGEATTEKPSGCSEEAKFSTGVSEGQITKAQKEAYEKKIDELVVPGDTIDIFKWHENGGSSFETLGVINAAGEIEYEPIGSLGGVEKAGESTSEPEEVKGGRITWGPNTVERRHSGVLFGTNLVFKSSVNFEIIYNGSNEITSQTGLISFETGSQVEAAATKTEGPLVVGGSNCFKWIITTTWVTGWKSLSLAGGTPNGFFASVSVEGRFGRNGQRQDQYLLCVNKMFSHLGP